MTTLTIELIQEMRNKVLPRPDIWISDCFPKDILLVKNQVPFYQHGIIVDVVMINKTLFNNSIKEIFENLPVVKKDMELASQHFTSLYGINVVDMDTKCR